MDVLGWRFIAVRIGVELGGDEAVDVELDAYYVSGFGFGGFGKIETFLDEEMRLAQSCVFPHLSEPGDALLPVKEGFVMRELGIFLDECEEGFIGFGDEVAEARG